MNTIEEVTYIYKFGAVFRTWSLASWSLKKSRIAASTTSLGRLFHGIALSGRKACWYPKVCVYGAWNLKFPVLLGVDACVRSSETGMLTRLWAIQYIMVTWPTSTPAQFLVVCLKSTQGTTSTPAQFLMVCLKSQVWCVMISLQV